MPMKKLKQKAAWHTSLSLKLAGSSNDLSHQDDTFAASGIDGAASFNPRSRKRLNLRIRFNAQTASRPSCAHGGTSGRLPCRPRPGHELARLR
jgi:hypothetical protein